MPTSSFESNTDFVMRLMTFSPVGALSQMFIIEAINRYAKEVCEADMSGWSEKSIINPAAWKRTAEFIKEEMEKKHGT